MIFKIDFLKPLIFFLLILMSVFSTVLMPIKIGLMGIILIIGTLRVMYQGGRINLHKSIFEWELMYLVLNLIPIAISLLRGNEYALSGIMVSIIEPIMFFVLISFLSEEDIGYLLGKFKTLTALICIYDITFFLYINGFFPIGSENMFPGMYANHAGMSIGFIKIHSNNIPWLMFLFPMTVSEVFISTNKIKITDYLIIFMALMIGIITLRTSYILIVGLTPFIIFLLARISHVVYNKSRIRIICIFGALILSLLLLFSTRLSSLIGDAIDKVSLSLSTTQNDVDSGGFIRMEQIHDLLETWKERPLLGWGAATNAKHIIRSDIPGNYEMQYFAMLMQRGCVGFGLLIISIIWIIVKNIEFIRRRSYHSTITFAIIVGYISIIIANATNPYLGSFDRLIIVFVPLMIYKANLLHETNQEDYFLGEGLEICQKTRS